MNLADRLGAMVGTGVYDVAFIPDKLGEFGFSYDRERDELSYAKRVGVVKLGAQRPKATLESMANDRGGGFLEHRLSDDTLLIGALELGQAIYVLLTGQAPPSLGYRDRSKGFRADVKAITKFLRSN